ncbi:CAP domain-containing protein [Pedobacter cryoconitis]|uniref:Cysteine-rich secretory protein family protein n=1 Tax=Pedobacter cryoconitis TaxID=188932 RepID=A0A327RSC7_9SPHI|nr:CAP domain-containing protein [Pedobacter cryoconitis]RAJ19749.1 Cysteine-rich secretory protein family protein [Pedobacter cryoconitis]
MNSRSTVKWSYPYTLILIGFMAVVLSCSKSKEAPDDNQGLPITVPANKNADTNLDNSLFLKLVNDVRTKGCDCKQPDGGVTKMPPVPILAWSNDLATIAKTHADDMEKKNYFDHTDTEGRNPGQRMTAGGDLWSAYAENIAKGQQTENEAFNSWINSDHGHCQNIMSANIKEMGVARSAGNGNYWTQLFGTRR